MAELARGAQKRILHGFFGGAEGVTKRPQLQALIVLHLKHDPFTGRQTLHRRSDARLDFLADESALGVQRWAVFALALEEIGDALLVQSGIQLGRLVFRARLAAPQLVPAIRCDDAVEPGGAAKL